MTILQILATRGRHCGPIAAPSILIVHCFSVQNERAKKNCEKCYRSLRVHSIADSETENIVEDTKITLFFKILNNPVQKIYHKKIIIKHRSKMIRHHP